MSIHHPGARALHSPALSADIGLIPTCTESRVRAEAMRLGYALPEARLDPDSIQRDIAAHLRRTVEDCLHVGRALIVLKEVCGHGNFINRLKVIGLHRNVAHKFMRSAWRLSNLPTSASLLEAVGNQTKLFELLTLDDEQFEELALTGQTGGLSVEDIAGMSVAKLRAAVRAGIEGRTCADPLQAGDVVSSIHAGRQGRVVKVYPDGSACVCWDDGEPQPEGMGHERMPRKLLRLVERPAPTAASSAPELLCSPLMAGDRVVHTGDGRLGIVQSVYPDGSVSVSWDGGDVSMGVPPESLRRIYSTAKQSDQAEVRTVSRRLTVSFRGVEYDVSEIPEIMAGETVFVTPGPREVETGEHAHSKLLLYPLPAPRFGLDVIPRDARLPLCADEELAVRHAREAMFLAARSGGRFIAVVGESWSGKTTLLRETIEHIKRECAPIVVIRPVIFDKEEMTESCVCYAILHDVKPNDKYLDEEFDPSLYELTRRVEKVLIESGRSGQTHVLMIDDAHELNIHTLKYLNRLLEIGDGLGKLLSIVLLGQPGLNEKLAMCQIQVGGAK
ncbi:AAA family ATPase [Thauera butanivorans]|uniref:AAA family ATPase n=1 Tax=Thauera butanivorans TaxID=86174 RepID=UPI000838C26F|nr:AAA family ATPase [Thauera butanivorans]